MFQKWKVLHIYLDPAILLENLLRKWSTAKYKIFWFNISMNKLLSMKKFYCTEHLCPQIYYCRNVEYWFFRTHYFHFCSFKIETIHQVFSKVFSDQNIHFLCDMSLDWKWINFVTRMFIHITVNCLVWHVSEAICEVARFFNFVINILFLLQLRILMVAMLGFENYFCFQVLILYQINMPKCAIA